MNSQAKRSFKKKKVHQRYSQVGSTGGSGRSTAPSKAAPLAPPLGVPTDIAFPRNKGGVSVRRAPSTALWAWVWSVVPRLAHRSAYLRSRHHRKRQPVCLSAAHHTIKLQYHTDTLRVFAIGAGPHRQSPLSPSLPLPP